jgi:hypothetical protein
MLLPRVGQRALRLSSQKPPPGGIQAMRSGPVAPAPGAEDPRSRLTAWWPRRGQLATGGPDAGFSPASRSTQVTDLLASRRAAWLPTAGPVPPGPRGQPSPAWAGPLGGGAPSPHAAAPRSPRSLRSRQAAWPAIGVSAGRDRVLEDDGQNRGAECTRPVQSPASRASTTHQTSAATGCPSWPRNGMPWSTGAGAYPGPSRATPM